MLLRLLLLSICLAVQPVIALAQGGEKAPPDALEGPPFVSAKAWIAVDGDDGTVLGGDNVATARPMASTTKIMTAWIVFELAASDTEVLDQEIVFSERAAKTTGSSAKLSAGDKLPVRELLYGLLLPSGNDAAVALAETFGPRFGSKEDGDAVERFVAEMNRRAQALGLKEMSFSDPHGLSSKNVTSARDLAVLARHALQNENFRAYVGTRRHEGEVVGGNGEPRTVVWTNTNRLLGITGYEGVKTGTTAAAGNCLVALGHRDEGRVLIVVLGSTSTDGRYVDARNLFRWARQEMAHKAER